MSLESALAANTLALKEHTMAMLAMAQGPSPAQATHPAEAGAPLPPATAPSKTPPAATKAPAKPVLPPVEPPVELVLLDYELHVKPRLMELARAKGADVVRALLSGFGAQKGKDVPPERLSELNDKITAALAA